MYDWSPMLIRLEIVKWGSEGGIYVYFYKIVNTSSGELNIR